MIGETWWGGLICIILKQAGVSALRINDPDQAWNALPLKAMRGTFPWPAEVQRFGRNPIHIPGRPTQAYNTHQAVPPRAATKQASYTATDAYIRQTQPCTGASPW